MKQLIGLAGVALAVIGCGGSPTITCQTQTCNNQAPMMFQSCAHADGSVSYEFGGMSCTCRSGDKTACDACTTQVANFCGGGGIGGDGGGGGTGACTAVFSGSFNASVICAMEITVATSANTWTLGTAGTTLPNGFGWTGLNFVFPGTNPAPGTYDMSMAKATSTTVTQGSMPGWISASGSGKTFGTMTATITSLGAMTTVNGAILYPTPHGTVAVGLQNQSTMTSDLSLMITF